MDIIVHRLYVCTVNPVQQLIKPMTVFFFWIETTTKLTINKNGMAKKYRNGAAGCLADGSTEIRFNIQQHN